MDSKGLALIRSKKLNLLTFFQQNLTDHVHQPEEVLQVKTCQHDEEDEIFALGELQWGLSRRRWHLRACLQRGWWLSWLGSGGGRKPPN